MPTKTAGKKKTLAVKHSRKPMRGGEANEASIQQSEVEKRGVTNILHGNMNTVDGSLGSLGNGSAYSPNGGTEYSSLLGYAASSSAPVTTDEQIIKDFINMISNINGGTVPDRITKGSAIYDSLFPSRAGIKREFGNIVLEMEKGTPREKIDFGPFMTLYEDYQSINGNDPKKKWMIAAYKYFMENVKTRDIKFAMCRFGNTVHEELQKVQTVAELEAAMDDLKVKGVEAIQSVEALQQSGAGPSRKKKSPKRATAPKKK
jgi:hypothetical protein